MKINKYMNYRLLKNSIKDSKVTFKEISNSVQMTEAGLRKSINNETLTISVFEKICDILELSPVIFFSCDYHIGNHNQINNGVTQIITTNEQKEIEYLKQLLEEKERLIQHLLNLNK